MMGRRCLTCEEPISYPAQECPSCYAKSAAFSYAHHAQPCPCEECEAHVQALSIALALTRVEYERSKFRSQLDPNRDRMAEARDRKTAAETTTPEAA